MCIRDRDYAGKIKDAIEKDGSGNRTGWIVNLKSRKQAVIRQDAEYDFMQEIMGGTNNNLPILLVDAVNCKEMVSSVEKAKAEIKYRGNSKVVFKVKKSEKLAPKKLPMLSTNFSDAFKYLLMRPGWIALVLSLIHISTGRKAALKICLSVNPFTGICSWSLTG